MLCIFLPRKQCHVINKDIVILEARCTSNFGGKNNVCVCCMSMYVCTCTYVHMGAHTLWCAQARSVSHVFLYITLALLLKRGSLTEPASCRSTREAGWASPGIFGIHPFHSIRVIDDRTATLGFFPDAELKPACMQGGRFIHRSSPSSSKVIL